MTLIADWNLRAALRLESQQNGIPLPMLEGMALTESAGDWWAWKTEPHYRYLVDVRTGKPFRKLTTEEIKSEIAPPGFNTYPYSSRDTEWTGQQASWGPLQIMGAVAREYGFAEPFPKLCSATGVQYAVRHLIKLKNRFYEKHQWPGVVAAYNAGSPRIRNDGQFENQHYVDKVARHGEFDWGEL